MLIQHQQKRLLYWRSVDITIEFLTVTSVLRHTSKNFCLDSMYELMIDVRKMKYKEWNYYIVIAIYKRFFHR